MNPLRCYEPFRCTPQRVENIFRQTNKLTKRQTKQPIELMVAGKNLVQATHFSYFCLFFPLNPISVIKNDKHAEYRVPTHLEFQNSILFHTLISRLLSVLFFFSQRICDI